MGCVGKNHSMVTRRSGTRVETGPIGTDADAPDDFAGTSHAVCRVRPRVPRANRPGWRSSWLCGAMSCLVLAGGGSLRGQSPPGPAIEEGTGRATAPLKGYVSEFKALGSRASIQVYASDARQADRALRAARREIDRLELVLSDYDPESELSTLHTRLSERGEGQVSEDLWRVMLASQDWYERSDGAFDASVGTLTRMWRRARRRSELPTSVMVGEALAHTGWRSVQLDEASHTVRSADPELRFDFGGIGAGYIIDRVYEGLVESGCERCLINISGDIRCGAPPPGKKGWQIQVGGLQDPQSNTPDGDPGQRSAAVISLQNGAVTTSGDLWQYSVVDGVRRSHIIDPRDGWGVPGPRSLTVIAATCLDADAGATALSVVPPQDVVETAQRWGELSVRVQWRDDAGMVRAAQSDSFPPFVSLDQPAIPNEGINDE